MFIDFIDGDLLNVDSGIVVHQVNCMGVMGAGLAKALSDKYADLKPAYLRAVGSVEDKKALLGRTFYKQVSASLVIANCFGQYQYGRDKQHTHYGALMYSLKQVAITASKNDMPVYIPYGLGCGLAGGDWSTVLELIIRAFADCSTAVHIVKK